MIKFWSTSGKYGPFSNFAKFPVFIDGKNYKTTEHYYQSQKVKDPKNQEKVRLAETPKDAKILASSLEMKPGWDKEKYEVMKTALYAKFTQNKSLKDLLLETGEEEIGEDSPYDYIWGLGKDGTGKNLLGKALMEIRAKIKNEDTSKIPGFQKLKHWFVVKNDSGTIGIAEDTQGTMRMHVVYIIPTESEANTIVDILNSGFTVSLQKNQYTPLGYGDWKIWEEVACSKHCN